MEIALTSTLQRQFILFQLATLEKDIATCDLWIAQLTEIAARTTKAGGDASKVEVNLALAARVQRKRFEYRSKLLGSLYPDRTTSPPSLVPSARSPTAAQNLERLTKKMFQTGPDNGAMRAA